MTDTSDTPPVGPETTAPPKASPAPAAIEPTPPAPAPTPTLTDADGFLGRLTSAMDSRFDKLAGRLETQLRPAPAPEPDKIEAPEHVEPTVAPAAAKKHWYFGK